MSARTAFILIVVTFVLGPWLAGLVLVAFHLE